MVTVANDDARTHSPALTPRSMSGRLDPRARARGKTGYAASEMDAGPSLEARKAATPATVIAGA